MSSTILYSTNLVAAYMPRVILRHAKVEFADISGAMLKGADLSFSLIAYATTTTETNEPVNLSEVTNWGGAIRATDFSTAHFDNSTDFRNTFLDKSVSLPKGFKEQMGKPCQWLAIELNDKEFFSVWRWWIEKNPEIGENGQTGWEFVAPKDFRNVKTPTDAQLAKYNLTDCKWKTDPMPGAEN